jgi:phage baseplate assembly protein W
MTSPAPPYRPFLGQGLRFPPEIVGGRLTTSRGEGKIEESIRHILGTGIGERLMRPDFGCGVKDLVFAPNNSITTSQVVDHVRRALTQHELRIDVLEVTAESTPERPNLLLIRIGYRVRENDALGNLVYPFFVTEGA